MSVNHSEISSFIWNVCDDVLRGLFKPHEYGDIILPFTVLRRLDCVLEPHKDTVIDLYNEYKSQVDDPTPIILGKVNTTFFNHSQYDLTRLKQDPSNVMMNFNNYLSGYSENVVEIIENFQLEKPIEKLNKNNRLFQFIEKFSEIDLHPDVVSNHQMGQIFEELLRKFSEMSNETSGEHYTPRDVVKLLVSMVFSHDSDDLQGEDKVRSIFDPCCGTGGMLTIGQEWVHENINDKVEFRLLGQELNPQTYSICKSDMMITGENPENIRQGSSLSEDKFQGDKFDYMITNPPYGVSWKSEKEFVKEEGKNPDGRFHMGLPRVSDGSFLFLTHLIKKMETTGSRIGIIFNGSTCFTGDSGSGESKVRQWLLEEDLIECIVRLPNELFFNTALTTYIWILSNKKNKIRKNKIQLINGVKYFKSLKKPLGDKKKVLERGHLNHILKEYNSFKNTQDSVIVDRYNFSHKRIQIETPLTTPTGNKKPKPDKHKRVFEKIPLFMDEEEYFKQNIKNYNDNSWVDTSKTKIGCEIIFNKYFYNFIEPEEPEDIKNRLFDINQEINKILMENL